VSLGWVVQAYKNCSSYFRIRDLDSGVVLRNLTESCQHSFGSAFVDTLPNGTEVLWIFGSSWWRPELTAPRSRFLAGDKAGGVDSSTWSGGCSKDATCSLGAFRTTDPELRIFAAAAIPMNRSTWNVDVTHGPPAADGSKTYVMAAEQQPLPGAPSGSSWTSYFFVNSAKDGDLTTAWTMLPTATHVLGGPGTHGACPTLRYFPGSGYYYVISGGLSVYLDRSKDLSSWEPSSDRGIVLQASKAEDTALCTEFVHYIPTAAEAALLAAPGWDVDASDVDLAQVSPTEVVFFYLFGNQGSTIFSALGRYNGTVQSWFEAQY